MKTLLLFCCAVFVSGCSIGAEGIRLSPQPPAVQGSNDAQGNPLSTPGSGMGVGSGNPNPPGASGMGPIPAR